MTLEERIALVNERPAEEPTKEDIEAIANAGSAEDAVSLETFMEDLNTASGRLLLRIPKSLHRRLKIEAKAEGVSVNQYATYKLAR